MMAASRLKLTPASSSPMESLESGGSSCKNRLAWALLDSTRNLAFSVSPLHSYVEKSFSDTEITKGSVRAPPSAIAEMFSTVRMTSNKASLRMLESSPFRQDYTMESEAIC